MNKTGIKDIDRYCEGVRSGKIPACKELKLAVERHYNDLEMSGGDWDYYFNKDAANHFFDFCENHVKHYEGEWAGKYLILEPWQKFLAGSLFGWLNKQTDLRRFIEAYIEIPKKNGKSFLAAVIGLYLLDWDGEEGAQIYNAATSKSQAMDLSYRAATKIVEGSSDLSSEMKITGGFATAQISCPDRNSFYKPIASNPKKQDGFNVHGAINDEVKDWENQDMYKILKNGIASRSQPIIFNITTAGSNKYSFGYTKRQYLKKILEGSLVDDSLFGIIYTIDEEDLDNWDTREVFKKANPNDGVSINDRYFDTRITEARESQIDKNDYLTKHLNVWVDSYDSWMDMEKWFACGDSKLTIDQFIDYPCVINIDAAADFDFTCMTITFFDSYVTDEANFYIFPKFYLPEDVVRKGNKQYNETMKNQIKAWSDSGYITLTPGDACDYGYMWKDFEKWHSSYKSEVLAFDPKYMDYFKTKLQDEGYDHDKYFKYIQNWSNISPPMKETLRMVVQGRIHHDNNPVMSWTVSNVVAKKSKTYEEEVFWGNERHQNRIDGAQCLIMAIGTHMFYEFGKNLHPAARRAMAKQKQKS